MISLYTLRLLLEAALLSTVPLAVLLVVPALVPAVDDATATVRRWVGKMNDMKPTKQRL